MEGTRSYDNCYTLTNDLLCCRIKLDDSCLWHQRLCHVNYRDMKKLIDLEVVQGVPKMKVEQVSVCGACQAGKQTKTPHRAINSITTKHCLELVYVNLIGPTQVESIGGTKYIFICVDDFSHFCWVHFLREKSYAFEVFKNLCLCLQKEKSEPIVKVLRLQSDHGREFENSSYVKFCDSYGIEHEFSTPKKCLTECSGREEELNPPRNGPSDAE